MNEKFENWLVSGSFEPCFFQETGRNLIVVRIPKNADFDILFYQDSFNSDEIQLNQKLNYAGIYCKSDGLLYDVSNSFICTLEDRIKLMGRSRISLREKMISAVRGGVEAIINNDRNNLQIAALSDPILLQRLESFKKYGAYSAARKHFLESEDEDIFAYNCEFTTISLDDNALLDYIASPEAYVRSLVDEYIADNQENILYSFLYNDEVRKNYQAIKENTEGKEHIIRRIMSAMKATSAKNVNVTVQIDDLSLTFKMIADILCRNPGVYGYNMWTLTIKDREAFENIFHTHYLNPKYIVGITYRGKSLYEASSSEKA